MNSSPDPVTTREDAAQERDELLDFLGIDTEDLGITPTQGPSCEAVRDLMVELLEAHSLVSRVTPIREARGDVGLRVEVGGLDFEMWVDPE
ncbi:hypothetical protein ACIP80_33355 [Streptomyces sp. NPDC088555]|uniref:hypothetical protein n=1 Tax=Streptomyces sp. NPDC088555 TaxID=3365866 RepID=UPI003815984B